MAHLNHKGPDEKGSRTGRKLGLCKKNSSEKTQDGSRIAVLLHSSGLSDSGDLDLIPAVYLLTLSCNLQDSN